jgi:hypothetical protein
MLVPAMGSVTRVFAECQRLTPKPKTKASMAKMIKVKNRLLETGQVIKYSSLKNGP